MYRDNVHWKQTFFFKCTRRSISYQHSHLFPSLLEFYNRLCHFYKNGTPGMCQIGNPQGTHPCRRSGCAGRSCRLHAHHTWPGNQWHQWHSAGFGSRKWSFKKTLKGQNCSLLLRGCGVTLSPLWTPRTSPLPSQGDRKEIFGFGLERAALGTLHHPSGWFVCSGTLLRYQLMLSWDPVLQSNNFLQDFLLQQLPVQCSCTSSENTHLYSSSETPLCSSSTGLQGLSQN